MNEPPSPCTQAVDLHAPSAWEYEVHAELAPTALGASPVVELSLLSRLTAKLDSRDRELRSRVVREAMQGKAAEGRGVFAATSGFWYASIVGPVLGADEPAMLREVRRGGATFKHIVGNPYAQVVPGDAAGLQATLAGQWILARWLDPEAVLVGANKQNETWVERYERVRSGYRVDNKEDGRAFKEVMTVVYADTERKQPVKVLLHVDDAAHPSRFRQWFKLEGGWQEDGRLHFDRVTEVVSYAGGSAGEKRSYIPVAKVPLEELDLALGVPEGADVEDGRLGSEYVLWYEWAGRLPGLAELRARYHQQYPRC